MSARQIWSYLNLLRRIWPGQVDPDQLALSNQSLSGPRAARCRSEGEIFLHQNCCSNFISNNKIKQTVEIDQSTVEIEERGVRLRLTVVDTPGYGDAIDNRECYKPILDYIDTQFEQYLHDESGLNRRNISDHRVHCCFYFISPTGHGLKVSLLELETILSGTCKHNCKQLNAQRLLFSCFIRILEICWLIRILKPLDIEFIKSLHNRVNIVPVIAKADTLTKKEISRLKKRILDEIAKHNIKIYQLPDVEEDEEEDYKEQTRVLKVIRILFSDYQ